MENRLLILVGIIFLICVVFGYVWGFLKFGLSLFSTVITLVLVSFLSPYVSDALTKYTPIDELIEKKCIETFMPEIPVEDLLKADLSGTPLAGTCEEKSRFYPGRQTEHGACTGDEYGRKQNPEGV